MTFDIRPKRIEYVTTEQRLETFTHWPRDHTVTVQTAANAGYFYTGYGDCLRCFCCGGGLRNWQPEDDVWLEHARWFPRCDFLTRCVGLEFVQVVQQLTAERGAMINLEMVQAELCRRENMRRTPEDVEEEEEKNATLPSKL